MIVFDGPLVLRVFTIHFSNVAIRLVANNYKHLMRRSGFDGPSVLLNLPLFLGFPVCSPVCWLDTVEDNSSVFDELEFGCSYGSIICLVEISIDVEGLLVVIFKLIGVYTL